MPSDAQPKSQKIYHLHRTLGDGDQIIDAADEIISLGGNQKRGDLLLVILSQGLVQGIADGAAHAQLRQRQHGQDVGEQTIDAQIIR